MKQNLANFLRKTNTPLGELNTAHLARYLTCINLVGLKNNVKNILSRGSSSQGIPVFGCFWNITPLAPNSKPGRGSPGVVNNHSGLLFVPP